MGNPRLQWVLQSPNGDQSNFHWGWEDAWLERLWRGSRASRFYGSMQAKHYGDWNAFQRSRSCSADTQF
jgi:hypothetical protein